VKLKTAGAATAVEAAVAVAVIAVGAATAEAAGIAAEAAAEAPVIVAEASGVRAFHGSLSQSYYNSDRYSLHRERGRK
jgi:hypothetical protein